MSVSSTSCGGQTPHMVVGTGSKAVSPIFASLGAIMPTNRSLSWNPFMYSLQTNFQAICKSYLHIFKAGSTKIPFPKTTCPRKTTSLSHNSHLENLAYSCLFFKVCRTIWRWKACSSALFEYTKMSSMNMIAN